MDFLYYPLVNKQGIETDIFPGAFFTGAIRSAHRHRSKDTLAVLVTLSGDHRYSHEEIQELVKDCSDVFFTAQGSVTRAIQAACDHLNKMVLDRNQDRGYEGIRAVGSINLAVLHNDWLFVAQYGRTVTTLISSTQYEEFGISEGQSEALGQSKRILPRFYQGGIKEGDLILLNSNPPTTWNSYYLAGSAALTMPQVKQRLLNQASGDLEAIVIKCAEGSGQVSTHGWNEIETDMLEKATQGSNSLDPTKNNSSSLRIEVQPESGSLNRYSDYANQTSEDPISENASPKEDVIYLGEGDVKVIAGETEKSDVLEKGIQTESSSDKATDSVILRIARTWMNLKTANARFRQKFDRLRKKIAPNHQPSLPAVSPLFTTIIAIVLPLILILVSTSVFSRTGKTEQYSVYMEQAENIVPLAKAEKDPVKQYAYWEEVLNMAIAAESYNVTRDSRLLFEQAQFQLDSMDLAARLDFRPALTQFLPEGVVITRIQASSSGVYLLDKTSGSVMRIFLNTKGFYEIDDKFNCAPGPYGLETLTDLIDFVILPANDDNFKIMALDAQGNLLYCRPGELAVSRKLNAPEIGWGRIIGAAYENDTIYILDADNDAIWMYAGKDPNKPDIETATGIVFSENPKKYLDEDTPDLGGAIDLVINQDDLYILHADGHMTQCRYSAEKAVRLTECKDPSPYTDNRVGQTDKKPWIFTDSSFSMAQSTRLPNASVFILDSLDHSIYQVSFQLNLERILRAQYNKNYPLPLTAPSGFGITPESDVFLAYDNQLFIAPLK